MFSALLGLGLTALRRPPAAQPAQLDVEAVTSAEALPSNVIDINTRRRALFAVTSEAAGDEPNEG